MPREIITLQCGQCGNQIGCRFWELALMEHAACNTKGNFDYALSSFFRNMDCRHDPPLHLHVGCGDIPIHSLKARAILVDMEENVVNGVLKGRISDLFESKQVITGNSGSGNNWSHGYGHYGPLYVDAIQDKVRKEVEYCDSPQSFFLLHSLGGGTGSGLGSYMMEMLHDTYPELYRFTTSVYPSADDDVVTSPYNSVLSTASLVEHVDCVLPVENQALFDIVRKKDSIKNPLYSAATKASHAHVFSPMNEVIANLLLHLTSSVRFEGCLNVDLNEITTNLVPYPRLHFLISSMAPLYATGRIVQGLDQLFSEVFSRDNQLLKVNPTSSTYLGCALLLRGSSSNISSLSQNATKMKHRLKMAHWNIEGFKLGICHQAPTTKQQSLLCLANNTSFRDKLTTMKNNFSKLYKKRVFVHHYAEYMDSNYFDLCSEQLDQLIMDYSMLETASIPDKVVESSNSSSWTRKPHNHEKKGEVSSIGTSQSRPLTHMVTSMVLSRLAAAAAVPTVSGLSQRSRLLAGSSSATLALLPANGSRLSMSQSSPTYVEGKVPEQKQHSDTAKRTQKANQDSVTPRSQDFSRWYLDVIALAELADYGPVRGTMVIRPYGYAIWEFIQAWLDVKFKETGHSNMYFPQLIPYSFIEKEASHVEGFSPELALVTIGGGKELEERLVVRPTSETIVNHMFAQWVQSYRDLPLLINQWANVTRWEMRTRPFVRTLEFLWQEGHTAHATPEEAEAEALRMIEVYRKFAVEQAAIPVIVGRKSRAETFAGADCTYTIEAMMGDCKALQAGTSHNLGQNFARAFGTRFLDENAELQYVWQTSWGMSTRMVGAIIMTHGDDTGLLLPPRVAPIQVVVVPIWKKGEERDTVLSAAQGVEATLKSAGIRVKVDTSEQKTPGWKFNFWEMKGVPLRIEIGPRDVASKTVVVSRRDVPGKEGKEFNVSMEADPLITFLRQRLEDVQSSLLARATAFRESNIVDVGNYEELKSVISDGKWARGYWAGSNGDEAKIKEDTGATIRCFPFDQPGGSKVCFFTGKSADEVAIFAKAY